MSDDSSDHYTCTWCKGTGRKTPVRPLWEEKSFWASLHNFNDILTFGVFAVVLTIVLQGISFGIFKTEGPPVLVVLILGALIFLAIRIVKTRSREEANSETETDEKCPRCKGKGQIAKSA